MSKSNNQDQSVTNDDKSHKVNKEKNNTSELNEDKTLEDIENTESEIENESEGDIGSKLEEKNEEEELKKIKDQLLRALAENENLRKRTAPLVAIKRTDKDIEQIKKYGHIFFVRDLMSSVDNLTRAVEAVPAEKEKLDEPIKNLVVGVEIVLQEINSFLEKNHITKINPLGDKFDYNLHQAMYEAPSKDYDPGSVIEVVQPGYLLHDRLVRPAMVGISKKVDSKDEKKDNVKNI